MAVAVTVVRVIYYLIKSKLLLLLLLLLTTLFSFSQSKKDSLYDPKAEIVHNGNRYKVYNNWFTGGAGYALDLTKSREEFCLGIDYFFHLKWNYFQLGFLLAGREFGNYDNNNFHAGYVIRKETPQYNLCAFGGVSYATGYHFDKGQLDFNDPYDEPGAYLGAQAIYKLKYDIGIGITGMINYNKYNWFAGGRLDIYFSGAFKGKK